MLTPLKTAASLILFFRENSEYKNSGSWIEWRETVLSVYENQSQHGAINAAINAGKISLKKIKSIDDTARIIENFSEKEKEELISLLELYKIVDENRNSYIPGTFNSEKWNEIFAVVNISSEKISEAKNKSENWYQLQKENKFRTEVFVPASVKPVLIDFALRIFVLWLFQEWNFFTLSEEVELSILPYWLIQIFIIPLIVFIYSFYRDKKIIAQTQSLVSKIQISNIRIKIQNSAWNYLLVFILVISGSYITILIRRFDLDAGWLFFTIPFYGIYLLVMQTNFSKSLPNYRDIKQQIDDREHRELSGELTPDQNDEEIVNLEVNLKAENERMNAYIIEAVLFAALAFTGFVTIVSAGNFSFDFIEQFNHHVFRILQNFVDSAGENLTDSYLFLLSKNGIIVVLSYQLLFCAVFFLSVIASRLRYFKLTDYVDRFLQLSKTMNDKEENLLQYDKNNMEEINKYNSKIKYFLREGYKMQEKIFPIMDYMQFFRTLGIFMFFIVIVTGGLFVSPWLSLILMFVSGLSVFYFQIGKLKAMIKSFYISMQEFYYKADPIVNWVCWSMIAVAFLLRTFSLPADGLIMVLGFSLLFLHYLLNLFIPVQFDYEIKKSGDVFGSAVNFHKLLAYLFKIALAVFFMGYLFKAMHWPGASPMIIISALMLLVFFTLVTKVVNGPRWLEYFLSISFVVILITGLFMRQHWPGAGILYPIGVPFFLIAGIVTFFYRAKIRPVIKRAVLIFSILCILSPSKYLSTAIWHLSMNYDGFEKEQRINYLRELFNLMRPAFFGEKEKLHSSIPSERDSLQKLLDDYNKYFVSVEEPDYSFLNQFAWESYVYSDDSLVLSYALLWSQKAIEHERNWEWIDTYAALLYKLKKYEEAKFYAEEAYLKGKNSETKQLLNKIDSVLTNKPLP